MGLTAQIIMFQWVIAGMACVQSPVITCHYDLYAQMPKLYCIIGKKGGKKTINSYNKEQVFTLLFTSLTTPNHKMLAMAACAELVNSGGYAKAWEILLGTLCKGLMYFPKRIRLLMIVFGHFKYLNDIKKAHRITPVNMRNHQEVRDRMTQTVCIICDLWDSIKNPIGITASYTPTFHTITDQTYTISNNVVLDTSGKDIIDGGYEDNLIMAVSQIIQPVKLTPTSISNRLYWLNYLYRHKEYKIQKITMIKKITKSVQTYPIWSVWKYARRDIDGDTFKALCEIGSWLLTRKYPQTNISIIYLTVILTYLAHHIETKPRDANLIYSKSTCLSMYVNIPSTYQMVLKCNTIFAQSGKLIKKYNRT